MKKKNATIDDLAKMVKRGFDETAKSKEMNTRFKGVDKRFDRIENRLGKLEAGHEDIQLRLGNVPFRFEAGIRKA